jgi:hypothetical protein
LRILSAALPGLGGRRTAEAVGEEVRGLLVEAAGWVTEHDADRWHGRGESSATREPLSACRPALHPRARASGIVATIGADPRLYGAALVNVRCHLARRRAELDCAITEMALASGVARPYLSQIKTGRRLPRDEEVEERFGRPQSVAREPAAAGARGNPAIFPLAARGSEGRKLPAGSLAANLAGFPQLLHRAIHRS